MSLGRMVLVPHPPQPTQWSHHLPTLAAPEPLPPSFPKAQLGWEQGKVAVAGPSSSEL